MNKNVIIVDEKDNKIGLASKEEIKEKGLIHRSVHLMLFNSNGELCVQKRAITKKIYPGKYEFSVNGTVDNEDYDLAIKRETQEELGIKDLKFEKLFKYYHADEQDKAFKMVYRSKSDQKLVPDKREIDEIIWMSLDFLKKDIIENPKKYGPTFIVGIKEYFKRYKE